MKNDGTVTKTTIYGQIIGGYTPVTIKDKDSGKSFVINMTNARVKGNEAEWTIKDGKVYDKYGKTIEDNIMEVTRYQAALIKAAANGDGDSSYLDSEDFNGGIYAEKASTELSKAKSEYKLDKWEIGYVPDGNGKFVQELTPAAEASNGFFEAEVVNKKGEKGRILIDIRTPEDIKAEEDRQKEHEKYLQNYNKPWWKFW